ncbi:hypothetical protein GEMRC1_009252 [Eukaryota sp. GEM-RC1]
MLTNFIDTLAASVVVTFIIGVGDRHLDNILFQIDTGKVVHIDFGFICDLDPKFFQPSIRLVQDWVRLMGDRFSEFQDLCCTFYSCLRKNASVILSYVSSCLNSELQSFLIVGKEKVIDNLQKKFALHLTEEESFGLIRDQIEIAYRSVFAKLNETAHRLASKT